MFIITVKKLSHNAHKKQELLLCDHPLRLRADSVISSLVGGPVV